MYGQSPCTPINEFVHRLFCESKIPRSLILYTEKYAAYNLDIRNDKFTLVKLQNTMQNNKL